MSGPLLPSAVNVLILTRNFNALRKVFEEWSPADVADCIADLLPDEQAVAFRILPKAKAADVLEYLDHEKQEVVLKAMGSETAAQILNEMSPDDRTALLEELPPQAVTHMLALLTPAERKIARTLLNYPEDSVGRLMTPDFVSIRDDWTIQRALDHIRKVGQDSETLNVVYVLDDFGKLIDDVRIRELLLRPLETRISAIHDRRYIALRAADPAADAIEVFKKYDRNTLPVVDSDARLIGIVTIDDLLDVIEEEATRDVQMIGGTEALEESYIEVPMLSMVRKRATWLVLLFLSEMLTATAMGYFEGEISKAVVLAIFLPLIISSGGNSGSQATTLIIRAMAVGELKLRDWWQVFRRELGSGLSLGLILGVLGFARILFWQEMHFQDYGTHYILVALVVGISLTGVVLWGSLSGSMLPFLLRRVGLDPATSSAPFVATLVDVTGLVIYFNVALLLLRGTVL